MTSVEIKPGGKYIHYCWFGGKPLPKLARKCLKSWQKFLPDYEIIEWNEKNFDVDAHPFTKGAYEAKKWGFVADFARMQKLYEYGGIYFDTDMEMLANIDDLLKKDFFIGYEANHKVAAGVIGVKQAKNPHIKSLFQFYHKQTGFDLNQVWEIAIPVVLTREFNKFSKKTNSAGIDIYDNSIWVYPEDYFYPVNYDFSKKNYTANTLMVHWYDASWVPPAEKVRHNLSKAIGKDNARRVLSAASVPVKVYHRAKGPAVKTVKKAQKVSVIFSQRNKRLKAIKADLARLKGDYIVISHPEWLGVSNVARRSMDNILFMKEAYLHGEARAAAKIISASGKKLVIFNGLAKGWQHIAQYLREHNPDIILKLVWHGSNALLSEDYDYHIFLRVLDLHNSGIINEIGFVKESQEEFFRRKGYRTKMLYNSVSIENPQQYIDKSSRKTDNVTRVGLYAASNRWVKNGFNQISAISLFEPVKVDCVPVADELSFFANKLGVSLKGVDKTISNQELLKRMAQNDVNVYATFTEAAPLVPLESLELGVPCVHSNNNHYFVGTPLEKHLLVSDPDNIISIYEKTKLAIENREEIIKLYKSWRKMNQKRSVDSFNEFVRIK